MSKLIVMCGLPASGKSTLTKKLRVEYDAIVLSSDELRQELLGDVNKQDSNVNIFEEMNKRARNHIKDGKNVIYDATNINRKRRVHLITNEIQADEKHIYYLNTSIVKCYYNDSNRDRKVGYEVIDKMYRNLHIPTKLEGWDNIEFINADFKIESYWRDMFESILENEEPEHDNLFTDLGVIMHDFEDILNVPQDSKYHSFSISRHIFYTYKYILENYKGNKLLEMKVAALFHDLGKGHCKSFYNHKGEEKRWANYIGHENVSAQLAANYLYSLGYEDKFIKYVVDLIQFHMTPMNMSEKQEKKLKGLLTEEQYADLMFLHEADLSAK